MLCSHRGFLIQTIKLYDETKINTSHTRLVHTNKKAKEIKTKNRGRP